jgi:hypothetical protein
LRYVVRFIRIAEHEIGKPKDGRLMGDHERRPGRILALPGAQHQISFMSRSGSGRSTL